jgi:predicted FMN-binding regulatory protein PaiB
MNSTAATKAIAPDDVVVARADERLVHAYDQIARADEQLARLNEQLARLENEAKHQPSAAVVSHRPSRGGPALRGIIGVLLAACVFALAFVSQSSYGEAARSTVARWAPQLLVLPSWIEKPDEAAQPDPSTVQLAAATVGLPQSLPSVQTAAQDPAPAAPSTAELAQMLQTMTRDLANLEQGIGQLKANQEQIARDSAKAAEELKASQEQMTRLIARLSDSRVAEPNLRPRPSTTSALAVPPSAAPRPVPVRQSPQARPRPQAPIQLQPDDDQ